MLILLPSAEPGRDRIGFKGKEVGDLGAFVAFVTKQKSLAALANAVIGRLMNQVFELFLLVGSEGNFEHRQGTENDPLKYTKIFAQPLNGRIEAFQAIHTGNQQVFHPPLFQVR